MLWGYLFNTGSSDWGAWCGAGAPHFSVGTSAAEITLLILNHHTWVCGQPVYALPPSLKVFCEASLQIVFWVDYLYCEVL